MAEIFTKYQRRFEVKRFRKEYLANLVHHGKRQNNEVKVGDIVLIGSDSTKRNQWPMVRVVEIFPGSDGVVRVARVKTESGVLTRPLQKLYPLEVCHVGAEMQNYEPVSAGVEKMSREKENIEEVDTDEEKQSQVTKTRSGTKPKFLDL